MANELESIANPTSTPAAVSTGYQAQNSRALAVSNGIDNTHASATDATTVRLHESGAVDVSGTLFFVGSDVDLTVSSAGRYFIYLADGGDADHKTPTLGTDAGTFDASLNARYLATGERVLNWLIVKETVGSTKLTVLRMTQPGALAAHNEPLLLSKIEITAAGTNTFTAPRSQVYTFELQACGGDNVGTGGGYLKTSEFIEAGETITLTKSVSNNGYNSITGTSVPVLWAENGAADNPYAVGYCGGGAAAGSNTLENIAVGVTGSSPCVRDVTGNPMVLKYSGGASFYGASAVTPIKGYGSGGSSESASGAPGLFLIWG